MNLKLIISVTLFGLIIRGIIIYSYVVFSINSVTELKTGALMLKDQKGFLYTLLAVEVLQFLLGGLGVYKVR